jgi:hypothetical protein
LERVWIAKMAEDLNKEDSYQKIWKEKIIWD